MLSRLLAIPLLAACALATAAPDVPAQALLGQGTWSPAPADVQAAVKRHSTLSANCLPLRAKPVPYLDGFVAVVTTNEACGGRASAPLWVVSTDELQVLVSDVGNGIRVAERALSHGKPNLRVQSGRGTTCAQRIWRYDGKRYAPLSVEPEPCRMPGR